MAMRRFWVGSLAAMLLGGAAMAAADYVILEVGDHQIKKSEVQQLWSGLFPKGQAEDFDSIEEPIRQNVLRGAVSEYLLFQEAVKEGVDKSPELLAEMENLKRKLIVRAYLEKQAETLVSEEDVQKEYDRIVRESRDKKEVRARHILVEDEKTAKDIAKKLKDGAKFEELAKEYSTDPGSKAQGGDLGYFAEGQMVKPFEEAAFKLEKGKVSDPVESDFGWHLIKVEDKRDITVPTFSDMKDGLRKRLADDKLNAKVSGLIDGASIKYFDATGKEKDLGKVPEAAKEE